MAGGFTGTVEQFTHAEQRVTEVRAGMDMNLANMLGQVKLAMMPGGIVVVRCRRRALRPELVAITVRRHHE